jgi:hypothetical protein
MLKVGNHSVSGSKHKTNMTGIHMIINLVSVTHKCQTTKNILKVGNHSVSSSKHKTNMTRIHVLINLVSLAHKCQTITSIMNGSDMSQLH